MSARDPLTAPLPRSLLLTDGDRQVARDRLRLKEYRCSCGKLLFRGNLKPGTEVAAWCKKCEREVLVQAV